MVSDGALKKEEDLPPSAQEFQFYWDAFEELCTARPSGLSASPIPFTAIIDYCRIYDIEDFRGFKLLMRRLDQVYIDLNNAASKSEEGKQRRGSKSNKNSSNKNGRSG